MRFVLGALVLLAGLLAACDPQPYLDTFDPSELTWEPPELDNPVTVEVDPDGGSYRLGPNQDAVIKFPDEVVTGQVTVGRGDDVVMIGGEIDLDADSYQAALKVQNWTGTMHVEGLKIDAGGREGFTQDAIRANTDAIGSVAQFQNILVDAVNGERDGVHGDVIQTWEGPGQLRTDRFTSYSDYQAFFLAPMHFWDSREDPQPFVFRRTDLHFINGGWKLWVLSDQGGDPPEPLCFNCWGDPGPDRHGRSAARNDVFAESGVNIGSPPGGSFVHDNVGLGYRSPGYGA